MSPASQTFDWHNDLPHPQWQALYQCMDALPANDQGGCIQRTIEEWLQALAVALGEDAGVVRIDDLYCLYSSPKDQAERLARWSTGALKRIIGIVGEHRTPEMVGPRVITLFEGLDRYYDYIDRFYPDAGEFGGSVGVCIRNEYCHIAVGPGEFGERQSTLAHELTHLALAPLSLPTWLDEGVAQIMQEVLIGWPRFHVDRELMNRHRSLWKRQGLQQFWTGESFDSELEELSYHLAEVLARNILACNRNRFPEFLAQAKWQDAGNAAATTVVGISLGRIASEFLGEGAWEPQPFDGQS